MEVEVKNDVPETDLNISVVVAENVDEVIHQVLRFHQDTLVTIIKDEYPGIDIVKRISLTSQEEIEKIISEVKKKYPGIKVFYVDVPYCGVFVFRSQSMADVNEASKESYKLSQNLIADLGGDEALSKMDDRAKEKVGKDIEEEVYELSTAISLKRCVLFPYDFAEKVDSGDIPYGVIPILVDKINEVSGWYSVTVQEI